MTAELAVLAEGLSKSFGEVQALRGLDLHIPRGTVFGLLGRNGAGKTTLLRAVMGLLPVDQGVVRVLGEDLIGAPIEVRSRVAYVPQEGRLFGRMSLDAHAQWLGHFYPRFDREALRRLADRLEVDRKRPLGSLSAGNSRKAAVVLALASQADLVVMDEPAAGLDALARRELYDILIDRLGDGGDVTVVLSTHLVTDLERLAERVAMIDAGRTLRVDDVEGFTERYNRVQVIFPSQVPAGFKIPGAATTTCDGPVALGIVDLHEAREGFAQLEGNSELQVQRFPLHLEDVFVELVGASDSPTNARNSS